MLILIGILIAVAVATIRVIYLRKNKDDYCRTPDYLDNFMSYLFVTGFIVSMLYLGTQFFLGLAHMKSENVTYSQQLVSLNDGTGIEGRFSGGIFVSRGYVDDTQHFSYYRVIAPGQFALDKRNAQQSTIWTDATAETARVDITDKVYSCTTTWYSTWCITQPNEFVHADFHVPNDAIKSEFELDAK